jgi:hypothetical protein
MPPHDILTKSDSVTNRSGSATMQFKFDRDDARQRVTVTVRGAFSAEDAAEILHRCRNENIAEYSIVYDTKGLSTPPTVADAKQYVNEELSLLGAAGRGPIAIIADNPAIYNVACAYAVLARKTLRARIEVFRERAEAEVWLIPRRH